MGGYWGSIAYPNIKISQILFSFSFCAAADLEKTISKEQQHFRRRQSVPSGLEMWRSLFSIKCKKYPLFFSDKLIDADHSLNHMLYKTFVAG